MRSRCRLTVPALRSPSHSAAKARVSALWLGSLGRDDSHVRLHSAYGKGGRSISRGNRRGVTAEAKIETGAHHALGLPDVDEGRAEPGDLRDEADLAGAEIVVAVLDEAGKEAGEGIFAADADGPS